MAIGDLYDALSAAGYRVNAAAGTVDGVTHGIAWRLTLPENALDLSVSVSEKSLQKWQGDFTGGTVAPHGYGVRLTTAGLDALSADALIAWVDGWTAYAEGAAGASFDDSFESYREPVVSYFTGAIGALLGALVGVIPWVLTGLFGWQLWIFGVLISIGSFYGYQLLHGAHVTGFAVGTIVISSLIAVAVGQVIGTAADIWRYSEVAISFVQALSYCLSPGGLMMVAGDSLFALLACALGFVGIRGKVMSYTHESGYLRRRRFK